VGPGLPGSRPAGRGGDIRLTSDLRLIAGALGAAVRLTAQAWRRAWAALALAAIVLAAWMLAAGGVSMGLPAPVWLAAAAGATLVARAALWRLAAGPTTSGPVELRLAAVWGLSGLFLGVLALLLFVALLCFAYAAASAGRGFDAANVATWAPAVSQRGGLIVTAAAILGGAGWVWAAARISLAEAASVARGRVQVLSTWALTRGRVATILAGNAVLAAPPAVAFILLPAHGGGLGPIVGRALQSLLLAGLWLPMNVGLMAYVFDNCTGKQPDR
jgi:hypothetical protein